MNIKILYDNQAATGFRSGWGFSVLIDDATLFDTGESAEPLEANLRKFGVDPVQIQRVILSHEDWDHVGGIGLLRQCGPVPVYVPASFSTKAKEDIASQNSDVEVVEIGDAVEVGHELVVTPELGTAKKEIALAVRTDKGLVLIVGCSHPGLDRIMESISGYGHMHAVIGGFHGFSNLEALADVDVIFPTHCTQKKQEIFDMYPEKARKVSAGMEIDV